MSFFHPARTAPLFALAFIAVLTIFAPSSVWAKPVRYILQAEDSVVEFTYLFNGKETKGQMPVRSAELILDFDKVSPSKILVVLDPSKARAGFIFATEALKSKTVLNTNAYPTIEFASDRITSLGQGAQVDGNLTLRGVQRPMRLTAQIYRQRGQAEGDLSRLTILLTGTVNRRDFGATGYPGLVGDLIELRILARIKKQP